MGIIDKIKFNIYKRKWRSRNRYNETVPANCFFEETVSVGKYTYGALYVLSYNRDNRLIIGNFCSIAPNVSFILSADHYVNHISTYPYKVKVIGENLEGHSKGDIVVEDDVWIGYGVTIMSGVKIGQGAIIAAGAVVTKDIPPYAIAGGVPAKVIKYRFSKDIVDELMKIDYSKLTKELIAEHIDEMYFELKEINQLEWLPRK